MAPPYVSISNRSIVITLYPRDLYKFQQACLPIVILCLSTTFNKIKPTPDQVCSILNDYKALE